MSTLERPTGTYILFGDVVVNKRSRGTNAFIEPSIATCSNIGIDICIHTAHINYKICNELEKNEANGEPWRKEVQGNKIASTSVLYFVKLFHCTDFLLIKLLFSFSIIK